MRNQSPTAPAEPGPSPMSDFDSPYPAPGPARDWPNEARPEPREPDPGSRKAGLITWLVLVPVLIAVVALQQLSVSMATKAAEEQVQEIHPAGRGETFGLMSRFTVRAEHTTRWLEKKETASINAGSYMSSLEGVAESPADRVRLAIVAAEVQSAQDGLDRLDDASYEILQMSEALEPEYVTGLLDDIEILDRLYSGEALSDEESQRLIDHHGWHGWLALSFGKDNDDPARKELIDGGGVLLLGLGGFAVLVLAALLAGFVIAIVLIIKLGVGTLRLRFVPPAPGGSVYLETFAVFVGFFLVLQVISSLLEGVVPVWAQYGLQWLVALSLLWPLVRGVSVARWRADMGFVAPRGVFREIGAGIMVYLASVPLYFLAALFSFVLVVVREMIANSVSSGEGPAVQPPMSNPVFEMLETSDVLSLVVLGSLITVWAPLVEEGIMRGALFRHLRGRMHFIVAAIVSALLFGALHQYDMLMLAPVIALGASFAFIREWRGSLIGCMTAHAIHNATIFMLVVWLISAT